MPPRAVAQQAPGQKAPAPPDAGSDGFLLGDGRPRYGRETIEEAYYTIHLWRGAYPAVGLQHINNPGYNRDRGPVVVPAVRLHLEF